MTLQLLHSEFPYIWGKFYFLFYQCTVHSVQYFSLLYIFIKKTQNLLLFLIYPLGLLILSVFGKSLPGDFVGKMCKVHCCCRAISSGDCLRNDRAYLGKHWHLVSRDSQRSSKRAQWSSKWAQWASHTRSVLPLRALCVQRRCYSWYFNSISVKGIGS